MTSSETTTTDSEGGNTTGAAPGPELSGHSGELAVAERFAEMAEDEREHEMTLEAALERLEVAV